MVRGPQLDPLPLGELEPGDPDELTGGADLELVRSPGLDVPELDLRGARMREVALENVNLPVVRAARGEWREVVVSGRLGSVEAYDVQWRSVHLTGCKVNFLNLRGAQVTDLAFTDCVIEELDLLEVVARRVRLSGTRIGQLNVQRADLRDVDLRGATFEAVDHAQGLRGATISQDQLTLLAPLLAADLGLDVEP
jgi:uncharacterized protein YjbI with pentapeptide repeats